MSYSALDARIDFEGYIDMALQTRDIEAALTIRDHFAGQGDYEQSAWWHAQATKWEDEDWAHDRRNNN